VATIARDNYRRLGGERTLQDAIHYRTDFA
jgi:hypothetical protein